MKLPGASSVHMTLESIRIVEMIDQHNSKPNQARNYSQKIDSPARPPTSLEKVESIADQEVDENYKIQIIITVFTSSQ